MAPAPGPPISENPNFAPIDPGAPNFNANLRGNVYAPGGDPRLSHYQGATETAYNQLYGTRDSQTLTDEGVARYRNLYGTGAVDVDRVNPNVAFSGVNTDAQYRRVNPNVAFSGVNQDAPFTGVNTNVNARNVNTQVAGGPDVNATDPGRYSAEQDAAVAALGGPNRTELAQQALQDFDTTGERNLQNRFRRVGQTAAKFGRIGMGDVNAELGSIQGDFERDRMLRENELARSVAEGDISDRFRRVDATRELRGQESGIESGLRGESRDERAYDTSLGERNVARDLADRDFTTGVEERNVGRAAGERDTALGAAERAIGRRTGERDTALGLSERNQARDVGERDLESMLERENIGRRIGERDTALGLTERNQARDVGERDAAVGLRERNAARAFERTSAAADLGARDAGNLLDERVRRVNTAQGMEDQVFGQGQDNRAEMRGERGYQQGAAQQSLDNRIRERQIAEQERSNRITRGVALMQAGGRVPNLDSLVA